jgi:hypothetical protein
VKTQNNYDFIANNNNLEYLLYIVITIIAYLLVSSYFSCRSKQLKLEKDLQKLKEDTLFIDTYNSLRISRLEKNNEH